MTRTTKSKRVFIAASIVLVGTAMSLTTPRLPAGQAAQPVPDGQPHPTTSASSSRPVVSSAAPTETGQSAGSTATFADGTPLPVKTFDQRRAELDLKESELKLNAADTDFKRIDLLRLQGTVPTEQFEHARLAANLARIQFERAQLQFEQAMNVRSTAQARVVFEGLNNVSWSDEIPLREAQGVQWGISIRALLARTGVTLKTPWRMTLLSRTEGKVIDAELLPDLETRSRRPANGGATVYTEVHWGDVVRLSFDANTMVPVFLECPVYRGGNLVLENPPSRLSVKADTALRQFLGQFNENLKLAGVDANNLEDVYSVSILGVGGRPQFEASLKQFLGGALPGPVLQPDDHIIVKDARRPVVLPSSRPIAPKS